MRGLGTRPWAAAAAAVALLAAACGGQDSSGLATLAGTATTAAPVDPAEIEPVSEPTAVTQADAEAAEVSVPTSAAVTEAGSGDAGETATDGESESEGADEESVSDSTADEGSNGSEDTEDDGSAGSEDLTDEERLLEFAQCMRDNGVDFPDPVVEADGTVTFGSSPGGGGGGLQAFREIGRNPKLPAARDACSGLLEGLAFGPGQGGFDLVELQDTLLEFAQCMRDNGVDMGDPDLRDFAPGSGDDGQPATPFGDIDFSDPDLLSAFQTCQQLVSLATPRFGGGD